MPSQTMPHTDKSNTANGRHRYSITRAIRSMMPGEGPINGLEAEVHFELKKLRSTSPRGVLIDPGAMFEQRALDTSTGAGSVPTILRPDVLGGWIDALRPKSVLGALGAQFLNLAEATGTRGKFALPRFTTATTASWTAEGAAANATNATLDQALLTPQTVSASTDLSRKALKQATPDFDAFLFAEITRGIGVEVDRAALNGTGSSNQPLGLLQLLPAAVALGANGAAPTRAAMIELERLVGAANADAAAGARLGFVTSPNGRAAMRAVDTSTGSAGKWLWTDDDTILGKPALASSHIPSNITKGSSENLTALIYANWYDLIINLFSGVDTLLNPYTQSSTGAYRLSVHQDIACQIAHEESFRVINDMATS